MERFVKRVEEATGYVRSQLDARPEVALILGTGLSGVAEAMDIKKALPYSDIPHHPVSTVQSHAGRMIFGGLSGKSIIAMQGRFHLYEGYTPRQISFPIRVLSELGIRTLMISNAAGGLNPHFKAGDLMLITDHINFTGNNPLIGPNVDSWGLRFPDMTEPYDKRLQDLAVQTALEEQTILHQGVYVGVLGPSLETRAETRFLRAAGADAVGMSTIMEVIAAVHCGLRVLGISVISNVNLPDAPKPVSVEEIIATAEKSGPKLLKLVTRILEKL